MSKDEENVDPMDTNENSVRITLYSISDSPFNQVTPDWHGLL